VRHLTHYFAYGSNMSLARLRARVPFARPLGRARLAGWELRFDKHGRDGHAKANIRSEPRAHLWGVVYYVPVVQRGPLDQAEGLGIEYDLRPVTVALHATTGDIEAYTYVALRTRQRLPLQAWYLAHLLDGIADHALPADWRRKVCRLASAHVGAADRVE